MVTKESFVFNVRYEEKKNFFFLFQLSFVFKHEINLFSSIQYDRNFIMNLLNYQFILNSNVFVMIQNLLINHHCIVIIVDLID